MITICTLLPAQRTKLSLKSPQILQKTRPNLLQSIRAPENSRSSTAQNSEESIIREDASPRHRGIDAEPSEVNEPNVEAESAGSEDWGSEDDFAFAEPVQEENLSQEAPRDIIKDVSEDEEDRLELADKAKYEQSEQIDWIEDNWANSAFTEEKDSPKFQSENHSDQETLDEGNKNKFGETHLEDFSNEGQTREKSTEDAARDLGGPKASNLSEEQFEWHDSEHQIPIIDDEGNISSLGLEGQKAQDETDLANAENPVILSNLEDNTGPSHNDTGDEAKGNQKSYDERSSSPVQMEARNVGECIYLRYLTSLLYKE